MFSSSASAALAYALSAILGGLCALWLQRPFVVMTTAIGGAFLVCVGPSPAGRPQSHARALSAGVAFCWPPRTGCTPHARPGLDSLLEVRFQAATAVVLLTAQLALNPGAIAVADAAVASPPLGVAGTLAGRRFAAHHLMPIHGNVRA